MEAEALQMLRDKEEIRELYARYCFFVDMGMPERFAESFCEDGVLWLSDRGSFRGREEISAHVARRVGKTFHLIHNVSIDRVEEAEAVAHAYFQLLDPETAATVAYGTYDDLLVRVGGRWLWSRKKVNYTYRSPEYARVAAGMLRDDHGTDLVVPSFGATGDTR